MVLHVLAAIEAYGTYWATIRYPYRKEAGMWFYRLYSCMIKYCLHRERREHVLAAIDATSCIARFKRHMLGHHTVYGIH